MEQNTSALEILDEAPFDMRADGTSEGSKRLFVKAWGTFPTTGWQDPRLVYRVPRPGTTPPPDSFAEFDFLADPPPAGTVVLDMITPLVAVAVVELGSIVHGVRVFGQNNHKDKFVRFSTSTSTQGTGAGDDFIPIPWKISGGGDLGG